MSEAPYSAPDHSEEDASLQQAPAAGVTLRSYVVDEFGNEHVMVSHTTIPAHVFRDKAAVIRKAAEDWFTSLGMQLVSLQREIEAEAVVISESPDPLAPVKPRHLRLVATGGRRILSDDARLLAASAGLPEEQARLAIFGDRT